MKAWRSTLCFVIALFKFAPKKKYFQPTKMFLNFPCSHLNICTVQCEFKTYDGQLSAIAISRCFGDLAFELLPQTGGRGFHLSTNLKPCLLEKIINLTHRVYICIFWTIMILLHTYLNIFFFLLQCACIFNFLIYFSIKVHVHLITYFLFTFPRFVLLRCMLPVWLINL